MTRNVLTLLLLTYLGSAQAGETERPAAVLLITSEALEDAWAPYRDWKTQLGKPTEILTVETIAAEYSGADLQAKIRACVLSHVELRGTRWVVLGGDSLPGGKGIVPDRDTRHAILGGRLRYSDIPTDLYYVTQGEWDQNGDGVFGDWKRDVSKIDHRPVAAIGRIPVRTAADVAAFTAKVIGYESRYPTGNFAKRLLYTNAVPQANYKADLLWDRNLAPKWEGGECAKFFTNVSPWDGGRSGDYALSPQNWVERINGRTAGKMHMHGHGFLPGWVLENHALADADVVSKLANEDAYLVMTTVSCFTGQFDAAEDPAITESMLRQPGGGAVAIVTCAREGVPVFRGRPYDPKDGKTQDGTTRLLTRFWVHGLSGGLTTGEALAAAKADLAEDATANDGYHWVLCEVNLLGDPTLDMRADTPFTPSLEAPESLTTGSQELVVDTGRPGLTVCAWKGSEVYAVATTNSDGRASLQVAATSPGSLTLTVTGPNVNTISRTLRVEPKTSQPRWFLLH